MVDLRVGVLGAGWVAAARYVPVLRRTPGVVVAGIGDRHPDRAERLAKACDARAFTEIEELLQSGLDVAFICTSPFSHAAFAQSAASRGIHIFTEKPMAMNLAEAKKMVSAAETAGVHLGVSHNFLFSRSMQRALRLARTGALGRLQYVLAFQASSVRRRLPHWYPSLPGGLFFDESPHMLYLMEAFMGELQLDHAWATPDASEGAAPLERLEARFTGSGRVGANLTMIFRAPVSEWLITAIGSEAVASVDIFRDICVVIPSDGSHRARDILRTSRRAVLDHVRGVASTGIRYVVGRQFWGHDVLIRTFLRAVREDRNPPVTGEDGARIVGLMGQILASAIR